MSWTDSDDEEDRSFYTKFYDSDDTLWTKRMAVLVFDTTGLSKEMKNRLRFRALYVLHNMEDQYFVTDREIFAAFRSMLSEEFTEEDIYLSLAEQNAEEFRGMKLMCKNMVDFEDYVTNKRGERAVDDLSMDELTTLVRTFINIEYPKRIKDQETYPIGSTRSIQMVKRGLEYREIVLDPNGSVTINSQFTCFGSLKEWEVTRECGICREDDKEKVTTMVASELCIHFFHRECLLKHFLNDELRKACPSCKGAYIPIADFPEWVCNTRKVKDFLCLNSIDASFKISYSTTRTSLVSFWSIVHMLNYHAVILLRQLKFDDIADKFTQLLLKVTKKIGYIMKAEAEMDGEAGAGIVVEAAGARTEVVVEAAGARTEVVVEAAGARTEAGVEAGSLVVGSGSEVGSEVGVVFDEELEQNANGLELEAAAPLQIAIQNFINTSVDSDELIDHLICNLIPALLQGYGMPRVQYAGFLEYVSEWKESQLSKDDVEVECSDVLADVRNMLRGVVYRPFSYS